MSEVRLPELVRLGQRIRHARERQGWSVRELGRKSEVSFSTISRVENATGDVWLSIAIRILTAVGLTLDDVLADCPRCKGRPSAGFTCNECGSSESDPS